jgi:hypothetical protein
LAAQSALVAADAARTSGCLDVRAHRDVAALAMAMALDSSLARPCRRMALAIFLMYGGRPMPLTSQSPGPFGFLLSGVDIAASLPV